MAKVKIGQITHYFDKIGVAVLEVTDNPIKVGDKIEIIDRGQSFQQEVTSMQIEHQNVEEASKGDAVGLKIDQAVKEGAEVYKVE